MRQGCAIRGTILDFLTAIVAKHQKIEGGPFGEKFFWEKISQCLKNPKGGHFGIFHHPFCRQTSKKLKEKNSKKKSQRRKKLKGGPFSLARYCMLRGKQEKPFWLSLLGFS